MWFFTCLKEQGAFFDKRSLAQRQNALRQKGFEWGIDLNKIVIHMI
jgi:hypothetical protein